MPKRIRAEIEDKETIKVYVRFSAEDLAKLGVRMCDEEKDYVAIFRVANNNGLEAAAADAEENVREIIAELVRVGNKLRTIEEKLKQRADDVVVCATRTYLRQALELYVEDIERSYPDDEWP